MKTSMRDSTIGPAHDPYSRTTYTWELQDAARTHVTYTECGLEGCSLELEFTEGSATKVRCISNNDFARYAWGHRIFWTKVRLLFKRWTGGLDLETAIQSIRREYDEAACADHGIFGGA